MKTTKKLLCVSAFLTTFALTDLAAPRVASADLSYVQTTKSGLTAMMSDALAVSKFFARGHQQRFETSAMGSQLVTISTCGSRAVTQIDMKNRVYTTGSAVMSKGPNGAPMGAMTAKINVKNLGMDTVNGQKAPHFLVSMQMTMQNRPMQVATEIWASKTPMQSCSHSLSDYKQNFTKTLGAQFGSIKITGDTAALGNVSRYVPLRTKISMGGMGAPGGRAMELGTSDTTKISTAPLPASLFAVPAGFRRVSGEAFSQIQQKAMQQKMGAIFKGLPNFKR